LSSSEDSDDSNKLRPYGRQYTFNLGKQRGVRRQTLIQQKIKLVPKILLEILGDTNSMLDVDFDED
jgi:hypothetical protein